MKTLYLQKWIGDTYQWEAIQGETLGAIYKKMCCMLSGDRRSISAYAQPDDRYEAQIVCSLYENASIIRSRNGRIIYKS